MTEKAFRGGMTKEIKYHKSVLIILTAMKVIKPFLGRCSNNSLLFRCSPLHGWIGDDAPHHDTVLVFCLFCSNQFSMCFHDILTLMYASKVAIY